MTGLTTAYYNQTAGTYDVLHNLDKDPEHTRALEYSLPLLSGVASVLDVGCGTGRTLLWLQRNFPDARLSGIDPSSELLKIAGASLPTADLRVATGEQLPLADNAVDLVTATGIMHHVDDPERVISEMFRVSSRYVLISDHNNFAFGGQGSRRLRLLLHSLGMLSAFQYVKQGFKRQGYSEDDGWWYPYSLLSAHGQISDLSERLYLSPTRPATGPNLLTGQSHMAILAIKKA